MTTCRFEEDLTMPEDPQDLAARWHHYLNAFMAEWDVPEDLPYAPGAPGEEPLPVLNSNDARVYASWLAFHGYISVEEKRWLYDDIARQEED
jgi:hypothetical protein